MAGRRGGVTVVEIADENVGAELNVPGFDIVMTTEAANRVGSIGSRSKYAVLWQQVGRPRDKVYRSSLINVAAVNKKCEMVDEKTGRAMWYRQIPAGGRPETVEPKYRCPACTKTFGEEAVESMNGTVTPGALQLDAHLRAAHSKATYERWKPLVAKLLETVVSDPRALFVDEADPDVGIVARAEVRSLEIDEE